MADIGNPVGGARQVVATQPVGPNEAVKAAQRAFFQAALAGADIAPPSPSPAARTAKTGPIDLSNPPPRPLRPGSLLDIKV